jgi:hypothetical protein
MTTIDAQGNLHAGNGQFTEKHQSAPESSLEDRDVFNSPTGRYLRAKEGIAYSMSNEADDIALQAQITSLSFEIKGAYPDAVSVIAEWNNYEDELEFPHAYLDANGDEFAIGCYIESSLDVMQHYESAKRRFPRNEDDHFVIPLNELPEVPDNTQVETLNTAADRIHRLPLSTRNIVRSLINDPAVAQRVSEMSDTELSALGDKLLGAAREAIAAS